MRQLRAILALVAITLSACAAGESTAGPSSTAIASTTDGGAPSESGSLPTASADAVTPSVAPYPPVVTAPTGLLPPDSVALVTANGLRVRAGRPGSPGYDQIIYTLSAGDPVLIGSSPLSHLPPAKSPDGRGWYEVHVGGAEAMSYADGGINGWVAAGESGLEWLELDALICRGSDTLAGVILPPSSRSHEWATGWDRLACHGGEQLELEGVIENTCYEGLENPYEYQPDYLANPDICVGRDLVVDEIDAEGQHSSLALHLRFPPAFGTWPERGNLVRVKGHFDDPGSSDCTVKVQPDYDFVAAYDPAFVVLACRERFVVDELTVIGHRDLAPLPWDQ